ncbi:MAG: tRNA (adenosine(37)-N6)-threonylcarbamoyltransferase complex ATPase subunit type 1 TsaE [Patescibacteria group bacterium]|nr:tRNA (adenosine(37)-N6)-threonylcarbamoyltransferase complex ATPase subunit type 1 TsaE [Patescibacteria group bacterium]
MTKTHNSENISQTKKIAKNLAKKIISNSTKKQNKQAVVLALYGNLGSGKTTFLQGFAKALKIKEKITSPTFVILKRFPIFKFKNFYHIDCYRIENIEEIIELNFNNIISDPKNIVAIEWPEKIKKILPKNRINIKFSFINKNKRKIVVKTR